MEWNNLKKVLEEYAVRISNMYQDKLISADKIASGELLNSVEYLIETSDASIEVSLKLADYWKFVEEGVNGTERNLGSPYSFKRKTVNVNAILNYIKVKPVIPDNRSGRLPTEQQLAYLIARKIARDGIEPGKYLEQTLNELMINLETDISDAVTKDIEENLDLILAFI